MGPIDQTQRTYPLKRPAGHKVEVPRWHLKLPDGVTHIYTLYVGVQCHNSNQATADKAEGLIEKQLYESEGSPPPIVDTFRVTNGNDLVDSKIWVAYWTQAEGLNAALRRIPVDRLWKDLGAERNDVGLWYEHFTTPVERLETNYARLDHKPGLAQIPGSEQPAHDLTAYWGAGRDRMPGSAHDLFEKPTNISSPSKAPRGLGEHLHGANYNNMCHIRSGQWWEQCNEEETRAYEDDLQKTLMSGMQYLWEHPEETGTIGLRFVQNLDREGKPIRETAGVGFHRNWADLEKWSSRHPSHLAIFNGAMKHAKKFGENRKFMTWHEVSILKAGEAKFDYVNCDPRTGVIKWVDLEAEPLEMA